MTIPVKAFKNTCKQRRRNVDGCTTKCLPTRKRVDTVAIIRIIGSSAIIWVLGLVRMAKFPFQIALFDKPSCAVLSRGCKRLYAGIAPTWLKKGQLPLVTFLSSLC